MAIFLQSMSYMFRNIQACYDFRLMTVCLFAIMAVSCSSGGGKPVAGDVSQQDAVSVSKDSLNSVAVFSDSDGRIDSMFSARGYVFGADIVKAARSGNSDAAFILAQMYAYGIAGAKPDRVKAFKLYVSLADNGNMEAKASAGYMLLYGCGVESDPKQGLDMLTDAANNDCATAYLFLGKFYADSEPTPENIRNAKLCYAQARDLGIVEADRLLKGLSD